MGFGPYSKGFKLKERKIVDTGGGWELLGKREIRQKRREGVN